MTHHFLLGTLVGKIDEARAAALPGSGVGLVRVARRGQRLMSQSFREIAYHLTEISKSFYARGWALGTSGNFSAVLSREPLRLAITPSAIDKSELTADQILEIDSEANSVGDHHGKPSDESLLHIQVVIGHRAGAVLHTHSIWSTICSDWYAAEGGLAIEGYEMLKGLEGVKTHQHREWVPIVENAQDMAALAPSVDKTLTQHPKAHGFLLRRHGLYTWGEDLAQAKRHVEIFEFLLETMGRLRLMESSRLWNR